MGNDRTGDPILRYQVTFADDPESDQEGILRNVHEVRQKFGDDVANITDNLFWKKPCHFRFLVIEDLESIEIKSDQFAG